MSCSTLNSQPVRLNVSVGNLPEGFCPENMQALAQAIAERLVVTPNQVSSSFVTGSIAPTSNQGPWFKDCEEWYVFDDASGMYVPLRSTQTSQFSRMQVFDTNGAWTNSTNSFMVYAQVWGAGGGGGSAVGGGGGGGGYASGFIPVGNGQSLAAVVGVGGAFQANGGNSTFSTLVGGGGIGAANGGVSPAGGLGGTAVGTEMVNGGGGVTGTGGLIGGAGGSSGKGGGGAPGSYGTNGFNGTSPGGGGAGGTIGGSGANGRVIVIY